jgi:hypothetical protein
LFDDQFTQSEEIAAQGSFRVSSAIFVIGALMRGSCCAAAASNSADRTRPVRELATEPSLPPTNTPDALRSL